MIDDTGYTINEMVDYFQLHHLVVRHCFVASCEKFGIPCDRLDVSTRRKLARVALEHELPLRNIPARKGKPWVFAPYLEEAKIDPNEAQQNFGLNTQELAIVSVVVAGYTERETAVYYNLDQAAVRHLLGNIFKKLGVSTREELARFAVDHKLPLENIPAKTRKP